MPLRSPECLQKHSSKCSNLQLFSRHNRTTCLETGHSTAHSCIQPATVTSLTFVFPRPSQSNRCLFALPLQYEPVFPFIFQVYLSSPLTKSLYIIPTALCNIHDRRRTHAQLRSEKRTIHRSLQFPAQIRSLVIHLLCITYFRVLHVSRPPLEHAHFLGNIEKSIYLVFVEEYVRLSKRTSYRARAQHGFSLLIQTSIALHCHSNL